MTTTTVRVDVVTHAALVALGSEVGASLQDTVRDAAEALRRQRFGRRVAQEFSALSDRPADIGGYLADTEATDVADGIG